MADCHTAIVKCKSDLKANPDIAGNGILIASFTSAWVSVLLAIVAYCFDLVPLELLTTYDILFCKRRGKGNSRGRLAARRLIMAFSDQQIITGIAILITAFLQRRSISVFHWHVVVFLAWMSSNVHLTSLTYLRFHLGRVPVLRAWRLTGMSLLFCLLFAALYPASGSQFQCELVKPLFATGCTALRLPSSCYWDFGVVSKAYTDDEYRRHCRGPNHLSPNVAVSYIFLTVSYVWKASMLFERGRQVLRLNPLAPLERLIVKLDTQPKHLHWRIFYAILLATYIPSFAALEVARSFAGSLWLVALGIAWGTIQILQQRRRISSYFESEESAWSFGQILPVLLLAAPLTAMLGAAYDNDCPDSKADRPIAEELHQSDMEMQLLYEPRPEADDQDDVGRTSHDGSETTVRPSITVAQLLQAANDRGNSGRRELYRTFYRSKAFKANLVNAQQTVLGLAIVMYVVGPNTPGRVFDVFFVAAGPAASFGLMCNLIAARWSSLYRTR